MKKIILLTIAILMAIGATKIIQIKKEKEEKLPPAKIYPIVVKKFIPSKKDLIITLPYIATAKSEKDVAIASKFVGKITYIKPEGSKVKKGEIVVKIDNSDLIAKEKEIKNNINSLKQKLVSLNLTLNNLKKSHYRTKKLLEVNMASIEEYQMEENKIADLKASIKNIKNQINSLKASLKNIKNNLSYTNIKAPISGTISFKSLNLGDLTMPGKVILKISSPANNLILTLPTPKNEIIYNKKIYKLIPLHTTINGLKVYKAKIDENLTNNEKVKIEIVEFRGKGIAIPYSAILNLNGKNYVFNTQGVAIPVKIIARGEKVAVVKNINFPIIVASSDIFLKIKAGYPIKVK
jgi:RND family efflux transporter MFP subunit